MNYIQLTNPLMIPKGETYGIFFRLLGSSVFYTSNPTPSVFTTSELQITVGSLVGYAGTPPTPTLHPRGFTGAIVYEPAVFAPNDAGVASIDSPMAFCPGTHPVWVSVRNYGTNQIDSVTVNWSVNGVVQPPVFVNQLIDTVNGLGPNQVSVNLGTFNFLSGQFYEIKAWTSMPNGVPDTINRNDTTQRIVTPGMTGTVTVNAGLPTGSGNYQTFSELATALNIGGVCGPLVVNVAPSSGPYLEKVHFGNILGTSTTNTITINGNGNTISYTSPNTNDRVTWEMEGTKYMIIDSLTIRSDSGAQGFSVRMHGNADWNVFRRCSIISSTTSTSVAYAGIVLGGSPTSATLSSTSGSNNLFEYNYFIGGYYAITNLSVSSTDRAENNRIIHNHFVDFYLYGVYGSNQDDWEVFGNDISRPSRTTISTFYGIYMVTSGSGVKVFNNKIHNAHGANPYSATFAGYPIFFSSVSGTAAKPNIIANNLIYDIQTNRVFYGIYLSGITNHTKIFHNTVVFNTLSTSSSITRMIWVAGTPTEGVEIRNNLLYLDRPGTGDRMLTYITSSSAAVWISNNAYYKEPSTSMAPASFFRGTSFNTLADFQASGSDSNSVFTDPFFVDLANNDLRPSAPQLNSMGKNLSGLVPFDFDSVPRSTLPDPGAYEFDPPPGPNPGLISWLQPITPTCGDSATVEIRAGNFGQDTVNTLTISWSINGQSMPPVTWNGVLPTASTVDIILGTFALSNDSIYDLEATITASGPGVDTDPSNNSIELLGLRKGLSGVYTINQLAPLSNSNFQTFESAFQALSQFGICDSVTFEVVPFTGPYIEQPVIGGLQPDSLKKVKILGNGNELRFTATNTDQRYTLGILNSSNIEFDSLKIFADGVGTTQWGLAVWISNSSENILFKNCYFFADTTTTSLNHGCVYVTPTSTSGTGIGVVAHRITFENCTFEGGYYNLAISGGSTLTDLSEDNKVVNCTFKNPALYSTYFRGQKNFEFIGNDLSRASRSVVSTYYGFFIISAHSGLKVLNNKIHNTHDNATTLTGLSYPIYLSGTSDANAPAIVANNMVYNINGSGTVYAAYLITQDNLTFAHNTIAIDEPLATGTGITRGIWVTGTPTNLNILNNIVWLNRTQTSGTKHIVYQTTAGTSVNYNNNAYFTSDQSVVFGFNGSDVQTFQDWQALGRDQNAVFTNPAFVNPANDDFTPQSGSVNNIGANLLSLVPTDINGVARTATPDPGAIEFSPQPCSGVWALSADSIYPQGVFLSWESMVDTFEVEWGPVGFIPGSAPGTTIAGITSKNYNLSLPTVNTCFHVYVREVCGSSFGPYTGPLLVCTPIEFDAELEEIVGITNQFCGDSTTAVRFAVKNNGFGPITSLPYQFAISGDINQTFSGTFTTPIPPGGRDTITVGTLNTYQGGLVTITASVNLTNDQENGNDSINKNVTIIPFAPRALSTQACAGDTSATLVGLPLPGVRYRWFDAPTGGTLLGTNDSLTIGNINVPYYLEYQSVSDSLFVSNAGGTGCTHGNMFDLMSPTGVSITGFTLIPLSTATNHQVTIWIKTGSWQGSTQADWTQVYSTTIPSVTIDVPFFVSLPTPINLTPNQVTGFYVQHNARYSTGSLTVSNADLTFISGNGHCSAFDYCCNPRVFNGSIHYGKQACSNIRTQVNVDVIDTPTAAFTYTISNYTVNFSGTFTDADSVYWTFGTAGSSSQQNPTFTFPQNGVYPVCVTAFNACGSTTVCDTLTFSIGISEISLQNRLKVYPNPNAGVFDVTFSDDVAELPIEVLDLSGKAVYRATWKSASGHYHERLDLQTLPAGTYMLRIHSTTGQLTRKVVVKK
ncbi:hypothetical protein JCM31826_21860 [Thermaurantimonas aggregans]|uniref:PKD domain-containing protein n=1 Tax=Thermaurantimonas aggregans TaxID=2173829 RepID=A0A401XNU8_9FLAO|nr:T9SS type A sorting domain-containing protein [Thermaurantimonas aggregans]GCD78704.1 hypothetical protein JCM31826_21860 [Thermaurantimonas aggregans]